MGIVEMDMMTDAKPIAEIPAVAFKNVTCRFASTRKAAPGGELYTAVENVSLDVMDGEFVSVVGPTGCGKSTLLNVAAGLMFPTEGKIEIFGSPLRE